MAANTGTTTTAPYSWAGECRREDGELPLTFFLASASITLRECRGWCAAHSSWCLAVESKVRLFCAGLCARPKRVVVVSAAIFHSFSRGGGGATKPNDHLHAHLDAFFNFAKEKYICYIGGATERV